MNPKIFSSFFSKPFSLSLGICLLLSLIGLSIPVFLVEKQGYRNLLLAVPVNLGSPRIDIHTIEEFCKEQFLLTYEIIEADKVTLPYSTYPVTLIGTNSVYPYMLGLSMIKGSFFSTQAWEVKQKYTVLNEKAALTIFGSSSITGNRLTIRGDIFMVTGVIQDKDDENCRIYLPSSVLGTPAISLIVLLDHRIHETYAKNNLKTLGVLEGNFDFFNLETHIRLFRERISIALMLVCCVALLTSLCPIGKTITHLFTVLQKYLKNQYLRELLSVRRITLLKFCIMSLVFSFSLGFALFLILHIISICLPWQDIPSLTSLNQGILCSKITLLQDLELPDQILFGAYLIFLIGSWLNLITSVRQNCQ